MMQKEKAAAVKRAGLNKGLSIREGRKRGKNKKTIQEGKEATR